MKALVIGASGGFGGAVAQELAARGHQVFALVRPGGREPRLAEATRVAGDALDRGALARAAQGMDAIVFGFHLPYTDWDPKAIEAARLCADVAAEVGASVLFPGNVYSLGPDFAAPLAEDAARTPPTRKGEIRQAMEAAFGEATKRGAQLIVVRAGDYMGPDVPNTWFEMMTKRAVGGGAILDPGKPGVVHAWAYQPDVVRAGVLLLERRGELGACEHFHFGGFSVDSATLIDSVQRALGGKPRSVWRFPFWLFRLAAPFSGMLREVLDMHYLWTEPLQLDGRKLARTLPDFVPTDLDTAVTRTLASFATQSEPQSPRIQPASPTITTS